MLAEDGSSWMEIIRLEYRGRDRCDLQEKGQLPTVKARHRAIDDILHVIMI